jgi:hypothetical protein
VRSGVRFRSVPSGSACFAACIGVALARLKTGLVGALPSGIVATAVAPSEGSDFAARFAALERLPEHDPGVPETVAAQAADELPQIN